MKKKYLIILFFLIVLSVIGGWFFAKYYFLSEGTEVTTTQQITKEEILLTIKPDGRQSIMVKIFYPAGNEIISLEKKIYTTSLSINIAEEVIKEYLKELTGALRQTRLLGVYRDLDNIIYIDLSDDIRRHFSGDAKFEYNLLKSLLETVLTNVPDSKDVKLLLEGKEIETIGGHFNSFKTLKISLNIQH